MAEKRKVGFFGVFFNVKQWISVDDILMHSRELKRAFNALYAPADKKAGTPESFEALIQRLKATPADIEKRKVSLLLSVAIYLTFSLGLFVYMGYLIAIHGHLFAVIMTFILATLMLVYAFREHFFYMQICKRKLGGNLRDWVNFILRRSGK